MQILPKDGKHTAFSKAAAIFAGLCFTALIGVLTYALVTGINEARETRVIACPGGSLEFSSDYTVGTCAYGSEGPTLSAADLTRELGEPVTTEALECDKAIIDDQQPNGMPWGYCE